MKLQKQVERRTSKTGTRRPFWFEKNRKGAGFCSAFLVRYLVKVPVIE